MFGALKSKVGVLGLAAMMVGVPVGLAGAAGAAGNSANAHACQHGGFVNYSTASGTTFTNTGDCVSYAAQGGVLTPLPDLVPVASCTLTTTSWTCNYSVQNDGFGTATGTMGFSRSVLDSRSDGCGPLSGNLSISLSPGQSAFLSSCSVSFGQVTDFGSVHVELSVNTGDTIAESNLTNNTLDQTF